MLARRPVLLVPIALAVALAGCGGGSDDAGDTTVKATTTTVAKPTTTTVDLTDDYVDAFAASLVDDRPPGVTRADIECAAEGMVESITPERLQELGIEPDDIEDSDNFGEFDERPSRKEVQGMAEAFLECIDVAPVFAEAFAGEFAGAFGTDVEGEVRECVAQVMLEADVMVELMTEEIYGGNVDELLDPLLAEFIGCIDWPAAMAAQLELQLGEPLSAETTSCFDESIDNEAVSRKLVEIYDETGDTEHFEDVLFSEILPTIVECFSPEDRAKIATAGP